MKEWFHRISNYGVAAATPRREAKSIRLRNQLSWVTTILLLGNMPLQLLFWPQSSSVFFLLCTQLPLQLSPIPLNARGWYKVSYLAFHLIPQTFVVIYTLMAGASSNISLFGLTVIVASFFAGGNEFPRLRNLIIGYCLATVIYFEFHANFMSPLLVMEPAYLEWLRRTIDVGMVAFTLGLAAYIAHEIRIADDEIETERQKSEKLLLNVLPEAIAAQLKLNEGVIAERYEESSVLFADIAGFTVMSSTMPADKVVAMLDEVFREFDALAQKLGLEKIKTIGDAYMVAAGLPQRRSDHCEAIFDLAIEMQRLMREKFSSKYDGLALRIGIHTGPVVAGVIGTVKFAYDLWGDTVNTASRMESHGITGQIHVTDAVYERLKGRHNFTLRGELDIKGKGLMKTYLFST